MTFFSKWDFLKFSGKLKITHYPFKILPIIWFTNCVETKQISFIFFVAPATVKWKECNNSVEVPLILLRFGMTSLKLVTIAPISPTAISGRLGQIASTLFLSAPKRRNMGKWGQTQEIINTIIPYITSCSRSLVCFISSCLLLKLAQDLCWLVLVSVYVIVAFDGLDLAGDGLGLGGHGVGCGDRVDASPEAVGLSNLKKKAEKTLKVVQRCLLSWGNAYLRRQFDRSLIFHHCAGVELLEFRDRKK